MRAHEKVELALIAVTAAAVALARPLLPASLAVGSLVLVASAVLLGQGLLRDLYLKFGPPGRGAAEGVKSTAFCMESTIGLLGIVTGGVALALGLGSPVAASGLAWPVGVLAVGTLGFLMKDVVIDLRTGRIRRERDHRNLVVW